MLKILKLSFLIFLSINLNGQKLRCQSCVSGKGSKQLCKSLKYELKDGYLVTNVFSFYRIDTFMIDLTPENLSLVKLKTLSDGILSEDCIVNLAEFNMDINEKRIENCYLKASISLVAVDGDTYTYEIQARYQMSHSPYFSGFSVSKRNGLKELHYSVDFQDYCSCKIYPK